jgi:hypothetical protein
MKTPTNFYAAAVEAAMSLNIPIKDITSIEIHPSFTFGCQFEVMVWVKGESAEKWSAHPEATGMIPMVEMLVQNGIVKIASHTH